jgi:DNA-binding transcriptional LysR family regulator
MELRHLATFDAVLARGSFLAAARLLGCSQSTVTLHVQQLERDLGAALFLRTGRRVRLTEAGHLLAARGRHVLDAVAALRRSIEELGRGAAGKVTFGAIEPTASLRLAPLMARFCATRPALRLRMEVGGSGAVARGVAEGDLDLGVASPPSSRRLVFQPLFHEPMALLVPRRHPLAKVPRLRARDLTGSVLLMTEQGCAWRDATERALVERGVPAAPGVELGSIAALHHAVRAGLGLALVPSIAPPPPGTLLRKLVDVDLALPVGIVRRPEGPPPSPAVAAFLAELVALRPQPPGIIR